MMYTWSDYNINDHIELDDWIKDDLTKKYACDDKWSNEWAYYQNSNYYIAGKDAFCKVVSFNENIIASLIVLCHPNYPVAINPIIVNPNYRNKGNATKIIREFIENIDIILPIYSDKIEVGIDINNIASIRVFEKSGFNFKNKHIDGDFLFYEYTLN